MSHETYLWECWRDKRDADAFAEIVSRHSAMVFSTCRHVLGNAADAEDVAQECFLELMGTRARVRSLATWLHAVAVRRSIDLIRRNDRRRARQKKVMVEEAESAESGAAARAELLARVDEAIAELPEALRTLIVLRFLEGRTHRAIAGEMGVAPSTVRYRLERAIERTRAILGRKGLRVTTAALAAYLGTSIAEAAPPALAANLGKLAVADEAAIQGVAKAGMRTARSSAMIAGVLSMKLKVTIGVAALILLSLGLFAILDPGTAERGPLGERTSGEEIRSVPRSLEVEIIWEGTDEAAAGAVVTLRTGGDSTAASPRGATDASGHISLEYPLDWIAASLEVSHPGAAADEVERVDLTSGDGVRVSLVARVLTGAVLDAGTGTPIGGAVVKAGEQESETGPDGIFTLRRVHGGGLEVNVSAEGYAAGRSRVEIPELDVVREEFRLEPRLAVLCVDADGNAIRGARVYAADSPYGGADSADRMRGPVQSDARGLTFFGDLPRHYREGTGWQRTVYARVPGEMAGVARDSYSIGPEGEPPPPLPDGPVKVELRRAADVGGIVRVPPGFDPRAVTVRVLSFHVRDPHSLFGPGLGRSGRDRERRWPELFEVHPDADGRFSMDGLPSRAEVYLAAEGPGLGQAQLKSDDPEKLRGIVFDLAREAVIEGTLTYEDTGEPASGVTLHATPRERVSVNEPFEAVVDGGGAFRFTGLGVNAYTIGLPYPVRASGGVDRDEWTLAVHGIVTVSSGETARGIRLKLERGALVSGVVTDASTGEPVTRVSVAAVNGPPGRTTGIDADHTDDEGRYELRLPTGQSKIYLAGIPRGYTRTPETEVLVTIEEGRTAREDVDFTLTPGEQNLPAIFKAFVPPEELARARGRVIDETGEPLEGVSIQAHRQWMREGGNGPWINPTSRTFSGEDGGYEISVAAGKHYKVRASGERYSTAWSSEFRVELDGVHEVEDLLLRRGASFMAGVVVDPEGRPIEGVAIHASSKSKVAEDSRRQLGTSARGEFRIEHLMAREIVRVTLTRLGYERRTWWVAPGTDDLRLVLHPTEEEASRDGRRRLERAESMVGKPAPRWDVSRWIQRPARRDGRKTVFIYQRSQKEWSGIGALFDQLQAVERLCDRAGAVVVVVLSSTAHESLVRPELERRGLRLGVGIDRFVPRSESVSSDATLIAYGGTRPPSVFVIDSEGIIRHVQSGFDGLEEVLGK